MSAETDKQSEPHSNNPLEAQPGLHTTTVFYDGACPLCSREIGFYKNRSSLSDLDWVDVSACAETDVPQGLTRDELLARFHVRLSDGTLRSGPKGFGEIWVRMKGFSLLGKLLQINGLQPLLEWLYRGFLVVRSLIIKRLR